MQRHALILKKLRDDFRDILILAFGQTVGTVYHRDLAAEAAENLTHLKADVRTSHNDEVIRQFIERQK